MLGPEAAGVYRAALPATAARPNVLQVVTNASAISAPRARAAPTFLARLGALVALTKPRIIELLLVTTVPTMVVAAGRWPSLELVVATLVGGTLSAGGANAANMYIDRDIDALMQRTSRRPLVTGAISAPAALTFAVVLEAAAFLTLWFAVNALSAILALSAALFYVFVYTAVLKRRSPQNIVIGGAAGAVPVLVGWAAVQGSLGWAPLTLFALVFLWTPPHFWALAIRYREDYANASVPMMPVVVSLGRTDPRNIPVLGGYGRRFRRLWRYRAYALGVLGSGGHSRGYLRRLLRAPALRPERVSGNEGLPLVDQLPQPRLRGHGGGRPRPLSGNSLKEMWRRVYPSRYQGRHGRESHLALHRFRTGSGAR